MADLKGAPRFAEDSPAAAKATRTSALGVASWLELYAQRIDAGADVATVLDEVIAYCLKARARCEVKA